MIDAKDLLKTLLKFPSITPNDAGSMSWLINFLESLGFKCTTLNFGDTKNLYAQIGNKEPNLCFAGHLDVVPPGAEHLWIHPPFEGIEEEGVIYGRGAVDMKGSLAAFLAATYNYLSNKTPYGSISFIITSDEEGSGKNGTQKVVEYIKKNNIKITECLVGEPTSINSAGDMVKIGRRGSINFHLTVSGTQGHVAYPDLANNPIEHLLKILHELKSHALDLGYDFFQPSHLEITSIDVGNQVSNIIPSSASAKFNIRFNPNHTAKSLTTWVDSLCSTHQVNYELRSEEGCEAFLSSKNKLFDALSQSIINKTGKEPRVTTNGGTSDARFIKDLCPIVECGLTNSYAHHIDEHVSTSELLQLYNIYYTTLKNYFTQGIS